ncbi:MAG: 1,4-dihydroxy-2-naphthoate polyprenyltransferase [Deltaproteobacteria bacterium]|nr:1,4-dihydroxy-2-naphthoate polyprenyltransferase [Deltaproteobacteria bacterium]
MSPKTDTMPDAHSARAWLMALRPKTLPVGAAPITVGIAIAVSATNNHINYPVAAVCLITALLLQILSNLANDYFDFKKGTDTEERQGPPRTMQQGLISEKRMKSALFICTLLAIGTGSTLVWFGGWPYLMIGILALVSAIAYTGGPYPLGYNGLGDIFVFLFFGLAAVIGTTHLCSGMLPAEVWPAACAMGLLAVNLLVVNNVRDEHQDRQHGKTTLVVRWGRKFGLLQYAAGLFLAYMCVGIIASITANNWVVATGIIAPIGIAGFKRLTVLNGKELNPVLAHTARFTFLFGLILSLSLVIPLN